MTMTEPGKGHNLDAARAADIRAICNKIGGLTAERRIISDKIREIKQKRVKGDLDMKIADFNVAYRLYQLEQDDRNQLLETLRETFSALGIGEQLDFLPVAEEDATESEESGTGGGGEVEPKAEEEEGAEETKAQLA